MKRCHKCGMEKPVTEFNRNRASRDGLQARCKPCHVAANREWARRNPEVRREACRRQYKRELIEYGGRRPSKQSDRIKHNAHVKVEAAVRRGDLVRPLACQICGISDRAIHAHHPNYAKPLDVQWLCAPCHGLLHARERKTA